MLLLLLPFRREVLEHFNLEIPEGQEPTKEEEEIREVPPIPFLVLHFLLRSYVYRFSVDKT